MLPDLPSTPVTTVGSIHRLHSRSVLVLDFAAPRGPHRGRRFRIDSDPVTTGCSRVVFNLDGRAALRPPPWAREQTSGEVRLRLRPLPDRRAHRVPDDLHHALTAADLDLAHITDPELIQMLEMIVEAGDAELRTDRITVVVRAIAQATAERKTRP
jgi:hypothetical protein